MFINIISCLIIDLEGENNKIDVCFTLKPGSKSLIQILIFSSNIGQIERYFQKLHLFNQLEQNQHEKTNTGIHFHLKGNSIIANLL